VREGGESVIREDAGVGGHVHYLALPAAQLVPTTHYPLCQAQAAAADDPMVNPHQMRRNGMTSSSLETIQVVSCRVALAVECLERNNQSKNPFQNPEEASLPSSTPKTSGIDNPIPPHATQRVHPLYCLRRPPARLCPCHRSTAKYGRISPGAA
jgi:hypothetical protein